MESVGFTVAAIYERRKWMRRSSNAAAGHAQLQYEKRETTIRESPIAGWESPRRFIICRGSIPTNKNYRPILSRSATNARWRGIALPCSHSWSVRRDTLNLNAACGCESSWRFRQRRSWAEISYLFFLFFTQSVPFLSITSLTKLSASLDLKVGPITCRSCSRGAGDRSYPLNAFRFWT